MTIIKGTTKKGNDMLKRASYNEGYYLHEVYGSSSTAKNNAWDYCRQKCFTENGENFRIISHNTFSFSVAWEVEKGTRIETAQNSYLILSDEYC